MASLSELSLLTTHEWNLYNPDYPLFQHSDLNTWGQSFVRLNSWINSERSWVKIQESRNRVNKRRNQDLDEKEDHSQSHLKTGSTSVKTTEFCVKWKSKRATKSIWGVKVAVSTWIRAEIAVPSIQIHAYLCTFEVTWIIASQLKNIQSKTIQLNLWRRINIHPRIVRLSVIYRVHSEKQRNSNSIGWSMYWAVEWTASW